MDESGMPSQAFRFFHSGFRTQMMRVAAHAR